MFVFGDFNVYHKDWLNCSSETERSGELTSISNDLNQMVNFPTQIPDWDSQSCLLGFIYIFWHQYLCYNGFLSFGKFWYYCLSFYWPFHHTDHNWMPCFTALLMTILVLIGMVFDHLRDVTWRISLNWLLLLLLVIFVSGFSLQLMYISLMVSIRSSLTHLHGFQLLVLLP